LVLACDRSDIFDFVVSTANCARILAFFAVGTLGFSQSTLYGPPASTRATLQGSKTVLGYRLSGDTRTILGPASRSGQVLIRLPSVDRKAVPKLLGMLRHGADIELFLGWMDPNSEPGNFENHIEIFRGKSGTESTLVHDFKLFGGPGAMVNFFQPPDARDTPAVLFDVIGGASWATTYLLAPDRQSVDQLFQGSWYAFADLDRDGIYELITWGNRPNDQRCNFGLFGAQFDPEIFIRSGSGFQHAWPSPDFEYLQVVGGFADLYGDGATELIVLRDRPSDELAQSLAVYQLKNKAFRPVAQTSLPPQRIAFMLGDIRDSPNGKEIVVRTATPARYQAGGNPDARGVTGIASKAYIFRGGRLLPAPPRGDH
jgi:hypothetical protein